MSKRKSATRPETVVIADPVLPETPEAAARPRTKPSEVRRAELMAAGQALFLDKGIAATSIDDIAAAAGVAKGTFYLYFPSKDDLVAALRDHFAHGYLTGISAYLDKLPAKDRKGRLDAWVEGAVRTYFANLPLHDVLFHSDGYHAPIREHLRDNALIGSLAATIEDGSKAGAWKVDEPALTAAMLFYAIHGAVDHVAAGDKKPKKGKLIRSLQQVFQQVVKAA